MGFNLNVLYVWLNNLFVELHNANRISGFNMTIGENEVGKNLHCHFTVNNGKSFHFNAYKTENIYPIEQEIPLADINGLGTINEEDTEVLRELFSMLVDRGFTHSGKLGLFRQEYFIEFVDEETKQEKPKMIDKIKQTSYLIQDLLSEETSLFPGFDISVSEKNVYFKVRTLTGTDIVIDISDSLSRSVECHGLDWITSGYKSILPEEFSNKLKTALALYGYTEHSLSRYVSYGIFVTIGSIVSQVNTQIPTNDFWSRSSQQRQPNSNMFGGFMSEAYRAQLQSAMEQQQKLFQDGLAQMNKTREQQQRMFMNSFNLNPTNPYLPSPTLQTEFQQLKQQVNMLNQLVWEVQGELIKLQVEVRLSKGIDDIHNQLVNGKE